MSTTRIVLVRHGESEWNTVGRFQGHADPPLTASGRSQARELAETLADIGIAAVYTSDLRRAAETADVLGVHLGLEVRVDPDLREIDVGAWSGLTRDEVRERYPDGWTRWLAGGIGHDGETSEQLTERVVASVERIGAAHPEATVVVVSHGGSIRALRRHVAGNPGEVLSNCGTVAVELVDGVLAVRTD